MISLAWAEKNPQRYVYEVDGVANVAIRAAKLGFDKWSVSGQPGFCRRCKNWDCTHVIAVQAVLRDAPFGTYGEV